MFHYFGIAQDTKGNKLVNWQVECVDLDDGETVVPIFADENSTPIIAVSEITNRALSDSNGEFDFFVPNGTYSIRFYNAAGVFQRTQRFLPMYGGIADGVEENAEAAEAAKDAAVAAADQTALDRTATEAAASSAASSQSTASTAASSAASDAASAASDRARAETAADNAEGSEAAASNAASDAADAETARDAAQGFADAAELARLLSGAYSSLSASDIPQKVVSVTIDTAGSGGTDGDYPFVFSASDYDIDPTGTITVAGGVITAVTVDTGGVYEGAIAPTATFDLSAITGLTGAALTAVAGDAVPSGGKYVVTEASGEVIQGYDNDNGNPVANDLRISTDTANGLALPIAKAALQLPAAKLTNSKKRIDFSSDTAVDTDSPINAGVVTDVTTFARASAAWMWQGASLVAIASGEPALADEGIEIRPERTQILEFGQDFSNANWPQTGLASVTSAGTGPLGVDMWTMTADTGTSLHRVRQTEAVVSGNTYTAAVTFRWGTATQLVLSMGSSPFDTDGNPQVMLDKNTVETSLIDGAADGFGFVENSDGSFTIFVTKEATASANTTIHIYIASGGTLTFTGASESVTLISADLYEGDCAVPPIATPSNTDVTRLADELTFEVTGTRSTVSGRFKTDAMIASGGYFTALSTGTAGNEVAVIESDGRLLIRGRSGGSVLDSVTGPAISGDDIIAMSYDETTGKVAWAVNSVEQDGFTLSGGPTGITRVSIGCDGAKAKQINGTVETYEYGAGITSDLSGASSSVDKTPADAEFDRNELVLSSDGAGGAYVYHAAQNSDEYVRHNLDLLNDAVTQSYGLRTNSSHMLLRISETEFGPTIAQVGKDNPAADDSLILTDAPDSSNFNALKSAVSGHGNMTQTNAQWFVDGSPVTLGSAVLAERSIELLQSVDVFKFPVSPQGVKYATRYYHHKWTADGRISRCIWKITEAVTVANGSFIFMMPANNLTEIHSMMTDQGTVVTADPTGTDLDASYPRVTAYGDTYFTSMTCLSASINGVSVLPDVYGRNAASSVRFKGYCDIFDGDTPLVDGDWFEATGHFQYGKL